LPSTTSVSFQNADMLSCVRAFANSLSVRATVFVLNSRRDVIHLLWMSRSAYHTSRLFIPANFRITDR
jgi:mevalonate pyrophosphate decarboxylase